MKRGGEILRKKAAFVFTLICAMFTFANFAFAEGMSDVTTTIQSKCTELAGAIPGLAGAALGVAVLVFGVRLGWRLVRSLAGR